MPRESLFTVELDLEETYQDIDDRLGALSLQKGITTRVLKKALNSTAKKVGRELAALAQQRYRVKKIAFSREIKIKKATASDPSAVLTATGESLPTKQFYASPAKPDPRMEGSRAARVAILKAKSPRPVQSEREGLLAFIAEFQSGHVAVVQREPPEYYTGGGWIERKKRWGEFQRATGKLDDTRIQELYAPSVPVMLFKTGIEEEFIESMNPKIIQYLQDAITTQINTELYMASRNG